MTEIPAHLIKKSWEMYRFHSEGNGVEPDELHFVSGFAACMGVLIGSLDVGIPEGTATGDVMAHLAAEVYQYRGELNALEKIARDRTNRRNQ